MCKYTILSITCLSLLACAESKPYTPVVKQERIITAAASKQMKEGQVYKAEPKDVYHAIGSTLVENGFTLTGEDETALVLSTEPKTLERWATFFPARPQPYSVDIKIDAQVERVSIDSSRAKLNVQYIGPKNIWEQAEEPQFYNFLYGEIGRTLKRIVTTPKS